MNGIFSHRLTGQYVRNLLGKPGWANLRDNATVYNIIERELLAAKLGVRPGELTFEDLR